MEGGRISGSASGSWPRVPSSVDSGGPPSARPRPTSPSAPVTRGGPATGATRGRQDSPTSRPTRRSATSSPLCLTRGQGGPRGPSAYSSPWTLPSTDPLSPVDASDLQSQPGRVWDGNVRRLRVEKGGSEPCVFRTRHRSGTSRVPGAVVEPQGRSGTFSVVVRAVVVPDQSSV